MYILFQLLQIYFNTMSLKQVIQNPKSRSFQDRYITLGKHEGKKLLQNDCKSLGIRVTYEALQVIEKGYSAKSKKTWANDSTRWDYDIGRIGLQGSDFKKTANRIGKGKNNGEINTFGRVIIKKINTTPELTGQQEKLQKEKENEAKLEKKKQKKIENMKKKLASLETWEDLL